MLDTVKYTGKGEKNVLEMIEIYWKRCKYTGYGENILQMVKIFQKWLKYSENGEKILETVKIYQKKIKIYQKW